VFSRRRTLVELLIAGTIGDSPSASSDLFDNLVVSERLANYWGTPRLAASYVLPKARQLLRKWSVNPDEIVAKFLSRPTGLSVHYHNEFEHDGLTPTHHNKPFSLSDRSPAGTRLTWAVTSQGIAG
jgi:hypothetical protein